MTATKTLYIALELSQDKWLLACATAAAEKPRYRPVPGRPHLGVPYHRGAGIGYNGDCLASEAISAG